MLRLAYITHVDVRGLRAHVHNTLKTCEALQAAGAEVTLISPDFGPDGLDEIIERHDIRTKFKMVFLGKVGAAEQNQPSRIKRLWAIWRMEWSLTSYLWRNRKIFDLLYFRYHLLLLPVLVWKILVKKKNVYESHYVYLAKPIAQFLTNRAVYWADGVVAITNALIKHFGLSEERSLMAPCHAAEKHFVPDANREALRFGLGLPQDKTILCYTGSLGATIQGISYEVETMVEMLKSLPEECISLVVGARSDRPDGDDLRNLAEKVGVSNRVIIRDWCERAKVFEYLKASDILIMPRVGTAPGSSPSKMFDYLAVGKPIVAAWTPPVDDILKDKDNALLVDADKPEEWPVAVRTVLENAELRQEIVQGAERDADVWTWKNRGQNIKSFLEKIYAIR